MRDFRPDPDFMQTILLCVHICNNVDMHVRLYAYKWIFWLHKGVNLLAIMSSYLLSQDTDKRWI